MQAKVILVSELSSRIYAMREKYFIQSVVVMDTGNLNGILM